MHKAVFLIFALLFFSVAQASEDRCHSILTDNERNDSFAYSLNVDAVDVRDFGRDYVAQAIAYVRVLLNELGCSRADVNFGEGALGRSLNRCVQISRNRPHSRVCFVETNLGYFIVSRDYQTTVHLIFNRWD